MKKLLFFGLIAITSCAQQKAQQRRSQNAKKEDNTTMQTVASQVNPDSLHITKKFVTGQFNFHDRDDFVQAPEQYTDKEIYLQKRTWQAFKQMADSAQQAGIRLIIVSGTRNFNYQKSIWERKWQESDSATALAKARGILEFSSMPMTSRHHWGTDLDLNNLNNAYFEKGKGLKAYKWLKAHANDFGFYQPYTNKKLHGRTGYEEEKWHWSYLPLAGLYLDFYNKQVKNEDISGFEGADLAPKIDMVGNYVDGVSVKVKQYGKRQK